jgi:DNA polymerase-4
VPPAAELRLLHLLPARRLWGVGKVTAAKLEAQGVTTVGELAALERERLVVMVGQASGRHLHALAWGRDPRPVRRREGRRTIGAQSALGRRDRAPAERAAVLTGLVDRVTRRLRKACRACRTVTLRLRFDDFKRVTRSRTLARATDETRCIRTVAIELLGASAELIERRGLTLIGITLSNLCDARRPQLRLPVDAIRPAARPGRDTWVGALTDVQPHGDSDHWRRGRDPPLGGSLDSTIDQVVERFGSQAITRGVLVGRRPPITVPLLPD